MKSKTLKLDLFIATLLLIILWIALCAPLANAQCRNGACRQQVVSRSFVQPQIYYQVGQQLQREAVDTYQFRHSEEYQDLQFYKGFYQGVQSQSQAVPELKASTKEQTAEPAPEKYAAIKKHCASCHSGDEPKGNLWLDGTVDLAGPDQGLKRDAIIRAIMDGSMPKNKGPLDGEALGRIVSELYPETQKEE